MKWISLAKQMPPKCLPILIWIRYKDEDGEIKGGERISFWDAIETPDGQTEMTWFFLPCDCKEEEYEWYEVIDWAPLPEGEEIDNGQHK